MIILKNRFVKPLWNQNQSPKILYQAFLMIHDFIHFNILIIIWYKIDLIEQ